MRIYVWMSLAAWRVLEADFTVPFNALPWLVRFLDLRLRVGVPTTGLTAMSSAKFAKRPWLEVRVLIRPNCKGT